jgi:exosortase/archaeosortase family protein
MLLATAGACWPVWIWYVRRLGESPDDVLALAALMLLFALSARRRSRAELARSAIRGADLLPSLVALAAYAVSLPLLPRLASAMLAFAALGFSWSLWRYGTPYRPWAVGLGLLGLPMASSLAFYFGYPLRVASGAVALVLLRAGGVAATREGVTLRWNQDLVMVDAPCSGLRMLWAGLLLGCCLAGLFRLRARASLLVAAVAVLLAVIGNGLRTAALFWADTSWIALPGPAHEGVGAIVFAVMALGLVAVVGLLARQERTCEPSRSI